MSRAKPGDIARAMRVVPSGRELHGPLATAMAAIVSWATPADADTAKALAFRLMDAHGLKLWECARDARDRKAPAAPVVPGFLGPADRPAFDLGDLFADLRVDLGTGGSTASGGAWVTFKVVL